jgi:hypothetical protein
MGREPDVGQKLIELIRRMGRQTTEDVLEVSKGIDIVVLAGAGERVEDRRRPAAPVAPEEGPVPAVMLSSA